MPRSLTPDEELSLIMLARQIQFHYELDSYTTDQLKQILKTVSKAEREILARIHAYGVNLPSWSEEDSLALLDHLHSMTMGLRGILENGITQIGLEVGSAAILMANEILSFGNRIAINNVALTAEQLRSMATETPVGGRLLYEWIEANYGGMIEGIREEIMAGMLKGESYPEFVSRLTKGFGMSREGSTRLARTYVHSINTTAQEMVYNANLDIIKGVVWTATLESSYKGSGHGTCLRCAMLDGTFYPNGANRPPLPLHPNCRCLFLPKLLTWKELGIDDFKELEDAFRPYTIRPDQSIDVGGRRAIEEHGFFQQDYKDWVLTRNDKFQLNLLGKNRYELFKSGKIKLEDLVDIETGRLILLKELQ